MLCLDQLSIAEKIYAELNSMLRAKGVILFAVSLLAWGLELVATFQLHKFFIGNVEKSFWNDYLMSALFGNRLIDMRMFIFVTSIGLAITYLLFLVRGIKNKC